MSNTKVHKMHVVLETERDSWSGPECVYRYHETHADAVKNVRDINSKNTSATVPGFYVVAEYIGVRDCGLDLHGEQVSYVPAGTQYANGEFCRCPNCGEENEVNWDGG